MISKALKYKLDNTAAVTNIVGTKIFAVAAPEKTEAPAIVYTIQNSEPEYTKSGPQHDNSDVLIMLLSKEYTQLATLFEAVRATLERKHGTYNGVQVTLANIINYSDGYDLQSDVFFIRLIMEFEHN